MLSITIVAVESGFKRLACGSPSGPSSRFGASSPSPRPNKKWPHEPVIFPPSSVPTSAPGLCKLRSRVLFRTPSFVTVSLDRVPPSFSSSRRGQIGSGLGLVPMVSTRVLATRLPPESATMKSYRAYDARSLGRCPRVRERNAFALLQKPLRVVEEIEEVQKELAPEPIAVKPVKTSLLFRRRS